jgi:predicted ATPase
VEAQLIARLEHPHIVPLYDYWREPDGAYLVMRYLRGGNLEDLLADGACEVETAVSIMDQITSALATAHKQGVIHRDIKPANILLDEEGNAYLTDFGIAKDLESNVELTMDGTVIGSPKYISPEQLRQESVSPQTDIYSLGLVLYQLLTGQPPFVEDSVVELISKHLNDSLPSICAQNPELPTEIDAVIQQATAKNPAERFADMQVFKKALHVLHHKKITVIPEATSQFIKPTSEPISGIPHNLPQSPTPFVGREDELAALDAFIANPDVRLVTIVGPGGMGKSRLSLAFGQQMLAKSNLFSNGVFFVPLAALQQADEIVGKITQAVNLPMESETGRSPAQQLIDFLCEKKLLLILDNFEHLLEGTDLLSNILTAAPDLQILVTSRERLQLVEEQVYMLEGLAFPGETAVSTQQLSDYTAVQLFLNRTQRIAPNYSLTEHDAHHLTRLCQLVSGSPLALELAASWMDTVPLPEIVSEIQQNIDFLETDLRNIPKRHRSMRAVFDASWQHLSQGQQSVLAKLSMFRGGFTLEAATKVAGANRRVLARLTRQSLVQVKEGNGYFTMHELLRQYAENHLKLSGQETFDSMNYKEVQTHHAQYYCQLLHRNEDIILTAPALTLLANEFENIKTAWETALAGHHYTLLQQALFSLSMYYIVTGQLIDGERTVRNALETIQPKFSDIASSSIEIKHLVAGLLAWQSRFSQDLQSSHKDKPSFAEQSKQIIDQLQNKGVNLYRETTVALAMLFEEALSANQLNEAEKIAEEFLAFCRQDDYFGLGNAFIDLGKINYFKGNYDESEKWFEQAMQLSRTHKVIHGQAHRLIWLSKIALAKGDFESNEQFSQESIALFSELGNDANSADVKCELAYSMLLQGRISKSEILFEENISYLAKNGLIKAYSLHKSRLSLLYLSKGDYKNASLLAQECIENKRISKSNQLLLHNILCAIFVVQKKYDLANQSLASSQKLLGKIFDPNELGYAHAMLATCAYAMDQSAIGRHHLIKASDIIRKHQLHNALLWILPAMSLNTIHNNQFERAVTIFSLANQLPYVANSQWIKDVVGKKIKEGSANLSPELMQSNKGKTGTLEIWETAVSILDELTK